MLMDGRPVRFASLPMLRRDRHGPSGALLIPGFTAAENILPQPRGAEPSLLEYVFSSRMATLDRGRMRGRAETAIRTLASTSART